MRNCLQQNTYAMQGFSVAIYVQSTNLVYQRGTVTRFKNPARHMYKRCGAYLK
jgi:hypothetical protein